MATFKLSSAASLNLELSQNSVLGNGLTLTTEYKKNRSFSLAKNTLQLQDEETI